MSIEGDLDGRATLLALLSCASRAAMSAALVDEMMLFLLMLLLLLLLQLVVAVLGRPCGEASGTRRRSRPPTQPQGKVLQIYISKSVE